jgi:hypothetical protein
VVELFGFEECFFVQYGQKGIERGVDFVDAAKEMFGNLDRRDFPF